MTSKLLSIVKQTVNEVLLDSSFITEAKKQRLSDENLSGAMADAAGKAFEIHVGKHISHILNGEKGHPDHHYPEHFSDESGDSPVASAAKQKKILGSHIHDRIESHARRMAHHIINHIKKHTGSDLDHTSKVYWTSKPKDLERLTGVKDIKGTSDLVIHHGGKYHGISLKYSASGSVPGLGSPGIESLSKSLKADESHVKKLTLLHDKEVDKHVGHLLGTGSKKEKHAKFKELLKSTGSTRLAANSALSASKDFHKQLSAHFSDSFNKLDHHEKTAFIRKSIDAEDQPTIKPYRASYDGARGISKVENPTAKFDEIHKKSTHYSSEVTGATVNIHAHHKDGTKTKVCSFGIKNKSSSPYSGLSGRVLGMSGTKAETVIKKVKRVIKKKTK